MGKNVQLQRTLGLFEVTISGVGIILLAGIYALIGEAAGLARNAVWMSFALVGWRIIFSGVGSSYGLSGLCRVI